MSNWLGFASVPRAALESLKAKPFDTIILSKNFGNNDCALLTQIILEVVPNEYIQNTAEGEYDVFPIMLHPAIEEFFLLSAMKLSSLTDKKNMHSPKLSTVQSNSVNRKDCDNVMDFSTNLSIPVVLEHVEEPQDQSSENSCQSTLLVYKDQFLLKKINPSSVCDLSRTTMQLRLRLRFIYSSDEYFDSFLFQQLSDRKNVNHYDGMNNLICSWLENKIVKKRVCCFCSVSTKHRGR